MSYIGVNGNFDLMKRLNLRKVFKIILLHRPLSRAKIAALAELNKVTVSSCVDFFLEKELIVELGTTTANRGRPATLIDINPKAGVFVAFDIDANLYRLLVTDFNGKMLHRSSDTLPGKSPEHFLQLISEKIAEIRQTYLHYRHQILGIGLSLPGHYNKQTGVIEQFSYLTGWDGYNLRDGMDRLQLGLPFFIERNSNAAAMGEIHFGKSSTSSHLVFVNGNWGTGVGVCTEGHLFTGISGFAGRFGHATIHLNGKKCVCGNRGCWEAYASIRALYENLNIPGPLNIDSFNHILERLNGNDTKVVSAVHDLGYYLGVGISNLIQAYNPGEICIGGYLGKLGTPLALRVKDTVESMLQKFFTSHLKIHCSDLGELGASYGAVSIVREHLLDNLPVAES